jgi:25S rRNA (uracil2634-N3)-methyltransferase
MHAAFSGVTVKSMLPTRLGAHNLEHLAAECSLVLVMKVGFQKEDYPGYNQKRGDGARCDEPFRLTTAYTFMFRIGDLKKLKKMNRSRARSISNLGGSNVHTGQWATDAGPFHPLSPVEAWPPQPSQRATGRGQFHPLPPIEARPPVHLSPPINADPYIADDDGNKSLYLVFVGVVFLSILDCF